MIELQHAAPVTVNRPRKVRADRRGRDRAQCRALLSNALWEAEQLRSMIYDGLTGSADLYLRTELLTALDAVTLNIKRAW